MTSSAEAAPNGITYHEVEGLRKPLDIYHFATSANGVVYVSGMQGFISGTLQLVSDQPGEQARQVLANLGTVLEASGSSLGHVLKMTLVLRDMSDFEEVNAVINSVWPTQSPARTTIQAVIPKGCALAIEAIALQKSSL